MNVIERKALLTFNGHSVNYMLKRMTAVWVK